MAPQDWVSLNESLISTKEIKLMLNFPDEIISNTDIDKLIKSKTILEEIYHLEFKIIEDRTNEKNGYSKFYKLIINSML